MNLLTRRLHLSIIPGERLASPAFAGTSARLLPVGCHPFASCALYVNRMTSVAATAMDSNQLEAVYREEGDRLWRALWGSRATPNSPVMQWLRRSRWPCRSAGR